MSKDKLYQAKTNKNKFWNYFSFFISILLILLFLAILSFIIALAIPGFKQFGIDGILGTTDFNLAKNKAGVWGPIAVTLLVTFGSILIAAPIGIKTATFIKFRISKKYKNMMTIIIQALSGIPSVIFGLFALNSLSGVVGTIFGTKGAYNIINATIMLSFMILPTVISLSLNSYDSVDMSMIANPTSLGTTKSYSIYKIFKKKARNGVIVAVIIAIGRAFGETMALSMVLTSESYSILGHGIVETLNSSLGTLGSVIATNMFSETGGPAVRGVLYAFGIILFIIVMILNFSIIIITRKKNKSHHALTKIQNVIANIILWIPQSISSFINNFFIPKKQDANYNEKIDVNDYIQNRINKHKLSNIRTYLWIFWEIVSIIITFSFLFWITFDIIVGGANVIFADPNKYSVDGYSSTAFQYGLDTTGQAFINTLIVIFIPLIIAVPFALMIAIFLNEYSKNVRIKKVILFFVDSLGSSPSIIFGMFGLAVFIELLGLSMNGSMGRSLLAGSLTISIVILPALIRTLQQALEGVPVSVRLNAYSLGCTKWETIWKVVIKHAYRSMASSIVLAIGRIMAETAPLYLTAGLTSVSGIGLMLPGQTLTTRIYAQISGDQSLSVSTAIQYECAFITLILVILLIWIGCYIIPNSSKIKNNIIDLWNILINCFISKNSKILKKYQKQVIKKTLYLTKQQAINNKINYHQVKFIYCDKKFYYIKYIKQENLQKMAEKVFVKNFEN